MERKIGEIFEYNGEWYQCLEDKTCTCFGCDFRDYTCADISVKEVKGICQSERRKDNKSVIFKKLEKVGEPYLAHDHSRNKDIVVQDYKLYNQPACYNGHEGMLSFGLYGRNEIVTITTKEPIIEIKQTKEDMEEKTNKASKKIELNDLVNEYINELIEYDEFEKGIIEWSVKYSNLENIGKNLKPFDLNSAKAGKPVCTRDGRKARIICFDRINGDYYKIVACVTAFDGDFEEVLFYGIDGYIVDSQNPKDEDLMMPTEKKEGWVNVYKGIDGVTFSKYPYTSKDEAIKESDILFGRIDTIKVSWEE